MEVISFQHVTNLEPLFPCIISSLNKVKKLELLYLILNKTKKKGDFVKKATKALINNSSKCKWENILIGAIDNHFEGLLFDNCIFLERIDYTLLNKKPLKQRDMEFFTFNIYVELGKTSVASIERENRSQIIIRKKKKKIDPEQDYVPDDDFEDEDY